MLVLFSVFGFAHRALTLGVPTSAFLAFAPMDRKGCLPDRWAASSSFASGGDYTNQTGKTSALTVTTLSGQFISVGAGRLSTNCVQRKCRFRRQA